MGGRARQQRRHKTITSLLYLVTFAALTLMFLHRTTLQRIVRSGLRSALPSVGSDGNDISKWVLVADVEDKARQAEARAHGAAATTRTEDTLRVQDKASAVSVAQEEQRATRSRSSTRRRPLPAEPAPKASAETPVQDKASAVSVGAGGAESHTIAQLHAEEAIAAEAAAPASAETSVAPEKYVAKYGFYIHAFNFPAAVIYQVRQLKKFFPASPIYIMSDGGYRFDKLCAVEGCTFQLCPPANDRWHPWPFFRRMYDAAVSLNAEYIILLEPDNTIHRNITRPPTHDAGGLFVKDRSFGHKEYAEKFAQERKPGFKWRRESMSAGLCGGSYFRREAILDSFSDESVSRLDWNYLGEAMTKEVYSSDFAMPYLLAARGWEVQPWSDTAQMSRSDTIPETGPKDAAFRHYKSEKPTYKLNLAKEDAKLVKEPLSEHKRWDTNCQVCYDLGAYKTRFGSAECTNKNKFYYSKEIKRRYPGR